MCAKCDSRIHAAQGDLKNLSKNLSKRFSRDGFITPERKTQLADAKRRLNDQINSQSFCESE